MKICIVGAGSIGGLLGIHLAAAGHDVSLIARGAHLTAMRENGARLQGASGDKHVYPRASDNPADFGVQDYVFLTVKAPALREIVTRIAPLTGPDTAIVSAMNGVPWWFSQGISGVLGGRPLRATDPDGVLTGAVDPERIIGCVVHAGAAVVAPGVVQHAAGDLFILGEPDGAAKTRTQILADAITQSGLTGRVSENIHGEIWLKLLGNMGMGPIAALTRLTLAGIAGDEDARRIAVQMIDEGIRTGEALGLHTGMSAQARVNLGAELGDFKPSILQDLEKGRPMEIDAMVTVVAELGDIAGIDTPVIDTVIALLRAQARCAGLY